MVKMTLKCFSKKLINGKVMTSDTLINISVEYHKNMKEKIKPGNRQNMISAHWLIRGALRVKFPDIAPPPKKKKKLSNNSAGRSGYLVLPTMHCKSVKMEGI